jgi:hypothetical protein
VITDENGDLFTDIEFPLPRKGDQLFASGEDWYHNACINYMPLDWQWDSYAEGYKLAADILVGHVMETQADQDDLVYPIVFLYRQYLELRLKELILVSGRLLDRDQTVPPHHDLLGLWRRVRPNLETVWPQETEHLDAIEEKIKEFCKADAGSFAFRYPVDRGGKPALPDIHHINLRQLKEVISGVSTILEGSSIGMGEYLDAKNEMLAECRAEMAGYAAEMRAEYESEMRAEYEADMRGY